MHDKSVSSTGEGQSPIDLRGCRSIAVGSTGIRLLIPDKTTEQRLSTQFNVPSRLATVRQAALRGMRSRGRDPELFVQDCLLVGQTEDGHPIHLLTSILTTRHAWRGGWGLIVVPTADAEVFTQYLAATRAVIAAGLRKERAQRGSKN
jgi:hypothetical protein